MGGKFFEKNLPLFIDLSNDMLKNLHLYLKIIDIINICFLLNKSERDKKMYYMNIITLPKTLFKSVDWQPDNIESDYVILKTFLS
jgi:hypothetical protein